MAGRNIGSIEVTVDADTGKLKAQLVKGGESAGKAAKDAIDDELGDIGGPQLTKALKEIEARIEKALANITAEIGLDLDSEDLKRIQEKLEQLDTTANVDTDLDSASFEASKEKLDTLDTTSNVNVDVDDASLAKAKAKIDSSVGKSGGEKSGKDFADGFGSGMSLRMKAIAGLILAGAEPLTVGITGLVADAISILGSAFQALSSVGLASLPLLVGLAGAAGATMVGFQNMGGALTAVTDEFKLANEEGRKFNINAEDIQKAMDLLAPSAQGVVRAFADLQPQLANIQTFVQQKLFEGMDVVLKDLGETTIPQVGSALAIMAESMNLFFQNIATGLQGTDWGVIAENLQPAIDAILSGISTVFAQFGPLLEALTPAATVLADMFKATAESLADMIESGAQSGELNDFLQNGLSALSEWWELLKNVSSTIFTIFEAGASTGTSFVTTLGDIVGNFNEWLNTADGQSALLNFFETGRQVMSDLAPILEGLKGLFEALVTPNAVERFGQLAEAIGGVLPLLGQLFALFSETSLVTTALNLFGTLGEMIQPLLPFISQLAVMFGTLLQGAIAAVMPLLQVLVDNLVSLAPVLITLGTVLTGALLNALTSLATALMPIVPILADLIQAFAIGLMPILPVLATTIGALAPVVSTLVSALGGGLIQIVQVLSTVLTPLIPIIGQVAAALGEALAPLIPPLIGIITALLPIVGELAAILGGALAEVLPIIGEALGSLLEAIRPLVPIIGKALVKAAELIGAVLEALAPILAVVAEIIGSVLNAVIPVLADVLTQVLDAVTPLIPVLGDALVGIFEVLAPMLPIIITAFTDLLTALLPLLPAIISLLEPLLKLAGEALPQLLALFMPVIEIFGQFAGILATVVGAVADFVGMVIGWFTELFNVLVGNSIIPDLIEGIIDWFLGMPAAILEGIASLVTDMVSFFLDLGVQVLAAIVDAFDAIFQFFTDLPGDIVDLITRGLSILTSIGSKVIGWIVDGIESAAHLIWDWVSKLPQEILDLIIAGATVVKDLGMKVIGFIVDGLEADAHFIWDWVKDLPGMLVDTLSAISSKVVGLGKSIIGWIVDGIKAAPGIILDALKSLIPSVSSVVGSIGSALNPFDADGGLYNSPTPKIIGEAGREAVIPLDRPLSLIDPSVRMMAAMLRGQADVPGSNKKNGTTVNNFLTVNTVVDDPVIVATQVSNRIAQLVS